jgi:hypothetical protein
LRSTPDGRKLATDMPHLENVGIRAS